MNKRMINLSKTDRNLILISLSEHLESPEARHKLQPEPEKYPLFGYIIQDQLIEERIENLIMNN